MWSVIEPPLGLKTICDMPDASSVLGLRTSLHIYKHQTILEYMCKNTPVAYITPTSRMLDRHNDARIVVDVIALDNSRIDK